jgi:hypothetical protein
MRADVTSPLLCGLLYRKPMNVAVEWVAFLLTTLYSAEW